MGVSENDINNKIKDEIKRKCTDCNKEFTLELDELKFLNRKGFDLPKRCKCCRNKRKSIGGIK